MQLEQHVKPLVHLTCLWIHYFVIAVDSNCVLNVIQSNKTWCSFDCFKHDLTKQKDNGRETRVSLKKSTQTCCNIFVWAHCPHFHHHGRTSNKVHQNQCEADLVFFGRCDVNAEVFPRTSECAHHQQLGETAFRQPPHIQPAVCCIYQKKTWILLKIYIL